MATASNPFEGDALNRVPFATNLSKLIVGLKGGVIALDGEWGSGKTWFGERVATSLRETHQVKTIWLDTFAADWHDDPALSLLAEIADQLPDNKREKFVVAAAPIAMKIVSGGAKAGWQALSNWAGIDGKVTDQLFETIQGSGEAYIKKRIKDLSERKKSLSAMKALLKGAVEESGGKLVVFVDELDRCSPAYAIRFLERIKHLFDVDGVVFVLLWNRTQIQQAVKVFYGQDTDGLMYLDRFVDYPVQLPNHHLDGRVGAMGLVVEAEIGKLNGLKQASLHEARLLISFFSDMLALSAREVKHYCCWWVLSDNQLYAILTIWLLCLKVKRPGIYGGLRIESGDAHAAAYNLLEAMPRSSNFDGLIDGLQEMHFMCKEKNATGEKIKLNAVFNQRIPAILTVCSETIRRIESVKQ